MHAGLGTRERAFVIEDIFGRMEADIGAVNLFLGKLFHQWNTHAPGQTNRQVLSMDDRAGASDPSGCPQGGPPGSRGPTRSIAYA